MSYNITLWQVLPENPAFKERTIQLLPGQSVVVGRASLQSTPDMKEAVDNTRYAISLLSKKHGLLSLDENGLYYQDTDSKHGSSICGKPCEPHDKYLLRNGDELLLCSRSSVPLKLKLAVDNAATGTTNHSVDKEEEEDVKSSDSEEEDDSMFPSDDKYIGKNEEEAEKEAIQQELRQIINSMEDEEEEEEEDGSSEVAAEFGLYEDEVDDQDAEEDEEENVVDELLDELSVPVEVLRGQYDLPDSNVVLYAEDVESDEAGEDDGDYIPIDELQVDSRYSYDIQALEQSENDSDSDDDIELTVYDSESDDESPVTVTEIEYESANGRKRKRYIIDQDNSDIDIEEEVEERPAQRPRIEASFARRALTFAAGVALGGAGVFAGLLYIAGESI